MVDLEFRTYHELLQNAKTVRPGMDRMTYLDLKWLSPDTLLEVIEDQLSNGNSYDDEDNKFFNATKLVYDLVSELKNHVLVKKSDDFVDFEEKLGEVPVEVTQDFIRELKREGRSYEATQLLRAFHKAKSQNKIEGRKENTRISNRVWRVKKLKSYKTQEGNGVDYYG